MSVPAIPKGYHTITPYMTVRDAARAIEFYKQAFGAKEKGAMKGPDGKVVHAELVIGDSIIMLADEFPEFGSLSPQSTGGSGTGLVWTTKSTLPQNMVLSKAGVISGPPQNTGPFTLTIVVTDSAKNTASAEFPLVINSTVAHSTKCAGFQPKGFRCGPNWTIVLQLRSEPGCRRMPAANA